MTKSAIVDRVGVVFASMLALVPGALAIGCANVGTDDLGLSVDRKVTPPPDAEASCRVTGGGRIIAGDSLDSFGGNAQPFRNRTDWGEWNHVTHEGDHFHGDPATIDCFNVDGDEAAPPEAPANAIMFTGTGTWNDEDGCDFSVYIEDHGEPENDVYEISISCTSGASYSAAADLWDGDLQIHAVPEGRL